MLAHLTKRADNYKTKYATDCGLDGFRNDAEVRTIIDELLTEIYFHNNNADFPDAIADQNYVYNRINLPACSGIYNTVDTEGKFAMTCFSTDLSSVDDRSFPEPDFKNVSGWYEPSKMLPSRYQLNVDVVKFRPCPIVVFK